MLRARFLPSAAALAIVVLACGSTSRSSFDDPNNPNGPGSSGGLGGGGITGGPKACVDGRTCVGFEIHTCDGDGGVGEKVGECIGAEEACLDGKCQSGCAAVTAGSPSNLGCEFWAVDLDQGVDPSTNAAAAPWGIVVANPGQNFAEVTIEQNDAEPGQPAKIMIAKKVALGAGKVETVIMPTREVDGSLQAKNEGPGTVLSSRAFRVTSTSPIVVYQLNALAQAYSNDGSLLLPKPGLGLVHRVLSYPTAYPTPALGIVTRAYVTVVGVEANTTVTIQTSTPTLAAPGFPAVPKGGQVKVTLNPFDVFNLESDGVPGDFTGSVVVADKAVAVFTGTEMSAAPLSRDIPKPPSGGEGVCCLDHLEEQLFPVESYGKKFVVPHSAVRSSGGWVEPDIIRFMGVAAPATVRTNLPAPFDLFTVQPGEMKETYVQKDFIAESDQPVAIAQILVAQGWLENALKGDPSLTIFPAIDQYRRNYLFSVPKSWNENFIVITMPTGANITIDGQPLPGSCASNKSGTLAGTDWETRTCPLGEGPHAMAGDKAFGIAAYGYGNAGSYAFVGGANVTKIYSPPPLVK